MDRKNRQLSVVKLSTIDDNKGVKYDNVQPDVTPERLDKVYETVLNTTLRLYSVSCCK